MIILPERGLARGKMLLPQKRKEWIASSQRSTTFGIENQTRWRLDARLNDGHLVWRGWFDDREDCDEFLWAYYERITSIRAGSMEVANSPMAS